MDELFSFETDYIEAQKNDTIKILSKYKYNKNVTIKIESNIESLNGYYTIKKDDNFILEFKLTENTEIRAIKIWGAKWDFNGYLDCNINIKEENEIEIENEFFIKNLSVLSKSYNKPKYYKKNKNKNLVFNKTYYTLKKNKRNIYYISINKNITENDIKISDNSKFEIIRKYFSNKKILSLKILKKLELILSISINNITYNIPGVEIENNNDLIELSNQINMMFETHKINNINCDIDDDKLMFIIKNKNIKNIIINGINQNIKLNFRKKNINTNKLKIITQNKTNELTISVNKKNYIQNKCTLSIIKEFKNNYDLSYIINNNTCDIQLKLNKDFNTKTTWLLYTEDKQFFDIKTLNENEKTLNWTINDINSDTNVVCIGPNNIILNKHIENKKFIQNLFYYTININNKYAKINIMTNKNNKNLEFDVKFSKNTLSKENEDFYLKQKRFVIESDDKKSLKIIWLNNKPIKDLTMIINNEVKIPIRYINKNYFPTNIIFNNTNKLYNHTFNKIINEQLMLKYYDDNISGHIIINKNQRHFIYKPKSNEVKWELYVNDILLFDQTIFYKKIKSELLINYNNIIKYNNLNNIEIQLSNVINKEGEIIIESESNTNVNISGVYKIKSSEPLKIPIKSNRLSSVGWLAFRIYSNDNNIIVNNKKHIIMFN